MWRPLGIAMALALVALPASAAAAGEPITPASPTTTTPSTTTPAPGTTTPAPGATTPAPGATTPTAPAVRSPFKADRPASQPTGLSPNDVSDPYDYPEEPIVLTWNPVPGAAEYKVEISGNAAFTGVVWSKSTDQVAVAPDVLLPDGSYHWRVVATDVAGVVGVPSEPARFVKRWPAAVTGLRQAAVPGGPAATHFMLNPYFSWDPLPGAKEYEVDVAAGDQFATPTYLGLHFHTAFFTPGTAGVIPDDSYGWRVRARDPKDNPGPWTTGAQFTKAWVAPEVLGPADGESTSSIYLRWNPVPGAERYQVQITGREHTWIGNDLKVNAHTTNTGLVPDVLEHKAKGMPRGENYWWRVRPVINGVYGTWAPVRRLFWADQAPSPSLPTLSSTPNSDSALMPHLLWTPVQGASIYRVDVATDPQFNNLVDSATTYSTDWVPRIPYPDNQVGTGYWWRVVWGSGFDNEDPRWMVDEATVPRGEFRKQTRIVLGLADGVTVSEAPVLSWSAVPGAARYEVQLTQDRQFSSAGSDTTLQAFVWGTGMAPGSYDTAKRLKDGAWYWRVRPVDGAGNGQTWSPVGSFTLTSPRPLATEPEDGGIVVGSPAMKWKPVPHACAYQVQLNQGPDFPQDEDKSTVLQTAQTALVPTGKEVTGPGRWFWRVRADFCDESRGPWSPARSFRSYRPPDFGLNTIPSRVGYGDTLTVVGALSFGGVRVKQPVLVFERRAWPDKDYKFFGTIKGDKRGRFAFRIRPKRTASYRLRWAATDAHPEGQSPFGVEVGPRVTLVLASGKVARKSRVRVSGSVYPKRLVRVQALGASGWETIRTIRPKSPRFRVSLRATMDPGRYRIRLLVPGDERLATGKSRQRKLFVYDRFVVRGRR